jgi:hypothetical protein
MRIALQRIRFRLPASNVYLVSSSEDNFSFKCCRSWTALSALKPNHILPFRTWTSTLKIAALISGPDDDMVPWQPTDILSSWKVQFFCLYYVYIYICHYIYIYTCCTHNIHLYICRYCVMMIIIGNILLYFLPWALCFLRNLGLVPWGVGVIHVPMFKQVEWCSGNSGASWQVQNKQKNNIPWAQNSSL